MKTKVYAPPGSALAAKRARERALEGRPPERPLSVAQIKKKLRAAGVQRITLRHLARALTAK